MRRTVFQCVAVASACAAVSGCGSKPDDGTALRNVSSGDASGSVAPGDASQPRPKELAEHEIKSRQQDPGPRAERRDRTEQDRQLSDRVRTDAKPGQQTAPGTVLEHAKQAAAAWLEYRIEGVKPPARLVPAALSSTVPPMNDTIRAQGAARTGHLKAFSAHSDGKRRWIVFVSTTDARAPQVVVRVAQRSPMIEPQTVQINEGGTL